VTVTQSQMMFAGVVLVVLSGMGSAESPLKAQLSPADLVTAVIRSELSASDVTETRWKYVLKKEVDGKKETREVVKTKSGSLDRLIAISGRPLTDPQQRDETEHILRLSHNPQEQHTIEQTHLKDVAQCNGVSPDDPRRVSLCVRR
jgi:hypothetical protein